MQVVFSRVVVLLIDLCLIRRCSFLGDWSYPLPLRVTLSRLDQSDMLIDSNYPVGKVVYRWEIGILISRVTRSLDTMF
jgi:hypothetical protein